MAKLNKIFSCTSCGSQFQKWLGQCPNCGQWGTIEEEIQVESSLQGKSDLSIKSISDIKKDEKPRFSSGMIEFDRVLGESFKGKESGFLRGQVVLLSGEPGVGKSTILLQLVANVAIQGYKSLYVSAEESEAQIASRAERILPGELLKTLSIVSAFNVDEILSLASKSKIEFLVIDSIQTVFAEASASLPGSVSQIKQCASRIVSFCKQNDITVVIVGHINKEGLIAGPKILEHLVDSVFQLEGDEKTGIRFMRSIKNRFGPTMEVGMFTIEEGGMKDLVDPSMLLSSARDSHEIGVTRSVVVEGIRPVVVEVQALTSQTSFTLPRRVSEGISNSRLQRILAILSKYAKVSYSDKDVFVKISGGIKVTDPSIDLAIAVSLLSSVRNKKVDKDMVAFGELDLTGRIAGSTRRTDRIKEAKRLGYGTIVDESVRNVSSLYSSGIFI